MKKANVHFRKRNEDGQEFYGIGHWVESQAQYQCPTSPEVYRQTNCHTEFSKIPFGLMTFDKAKKEAKKLFGYAKVAES